MENQFTAARLLHIDTNWVVGWVELIKPHWGQFIFALTASCLDR